MLITIPNDSKHTVTTDGRQFMLRPEGVYFTGLNDLAFGLVQRGIITKDRQQTGESSRRWAENAADAMIETWVISTANAIAKDVFILFGDDRFIALPNPHGGWVLLNPMRDVLTLGDSWKGQRKVVVGYPASLRAAFDLAVKRAFHAQDLTITYDQVNAHVDQLASKMVLDAFALTGDPYGQCKGLPWKKPDAEWTKDHPDLPLKSSNYPDSAPGESQAA